MIFILLFFISIIGSLVLSVLLAFVIARLVSNSVNEAKAVAGHIASGDLSTTVRVTTTNEFGQLMESLEHMRKSLKAMVDSKDNFIALISHQLRTPLTVIRGNTEILMNSKDPELSENQKITLGKVRDVSTRLVTLVNEILEITKASATTARTESVDKVDVSKLVDEILSELSQKREESGVKVFHDKSLDPFPTIHINRKNISHVLMNVIDNAIEYSSYKKNVDTKENAVHIRYRKSKHELEIQIADSGIGIPDAEQAKIFEKFFRASNAKVKMAAGNGLGLYISKLLVDKMGGRLRFESTEGVGTTFYLTFSI